ncbi:MAG: hypothetical protein AAF997_00995 [Myxococcota bacterium]
MIRRVHFSLVALVLFQACDEKRDRPEPATAFAEVSPILDAACLECHSGGEPAAGYSVADYLETIRCVPDGQPATLPADLSAPILSVLDRADHASLLEPDDRETLTNWVTEGAWPARNGTHPGQWLDPRTPEWHGTYLRENDWAPLLDPTRGDACGLCHEGAPVPVSGVDGPAPGADDCTSCHDLPGGVMSCGTCHGNGFVPYPPRDQCYFPGPPSGGAHMAHAVPSATLPTAFGCQTCHFGQRYASLDDFHGDGDLHVVFQPAWGPDARYDFESLACATTCHTRGGSTTTIAWDDERTFDCGSCHQALPAGHSQIACTGCHRGITPEGDALNPEAPHMNGRIDAF